MTITLAFLVFSLFAVLVNVTLILRPIERQAADDLAALIELSTKTWVELPPDTRTDFEREMRKSHQLRIYEAEDEIAEYEDDKAYLIALVDSLENRIGKPVPLRKMDFSDDWLWVDIPIANRVLRIGFEAERMEVQIPLALVLIVVMGTLIVTLVSLVLVRRITKPLARLVEATKTLGQAQDHVQVPEEGPSELAELARGFNRMDTQVRELLANRTTLLAGVSHDLRTPIARVRLAVELLPSEQKSELEQGILDDLEEMDNLIGQAMEFARSLGSSKVMTVDVGALLLEIVGEYARGGHAVRLTAESGCVGELSSNALRRVTTNLLDNAVRYSHEQPVELSCESNAGSIIIRFADRGPGIPEAFRRVAFDPFWRMESSRNPSTGGSGLGLAVVKQLSDANGWEIELGESVIYGGLEVTLRLPLSTEG
ncbi:MAG: two-component sensor histidine kinase [endosymbiont of Escarpia spicata]|uniref:histidine kinase n=1 Tax=endosymbiont of Escarpia spicata TaxID=2200908 RepID=A0A370DTN6_9GAMM|nr:MAG: two-component sensor histidine kinase [endosymbiont of Escarpia spicata]